MVLRQLLLPAEGGGSLRRFLRVRKRLLSDQWHDNRPLRGPVPLLDLRDVDDASDLRYSLNRMRSWPFRGWRISDDGVIGGYSTSNMEFVEGGDRGRYGDADESSKTMNSPPFLRWSGNISTAINAQSHLARNVTRSGYAAILSPDMPFGIPLGNNYRALEICCRIDDNRRYAVNLHVESYFPEDVYQGFIVGGGGTGNDGVGGDGGELRRRSGDHRHPTDDDDDEDDKNDYDSDGRPSSSFEGMGGPTVVENELSDVRTTMIRPTPESSSSPSSSSLDVRTFLEERRDVIRRTSITSDDHPYDGYPPRGFQRFVLPFRDFVLTSRGRMRHHQRGLDGAICIESIGFTLMDGLDGDFQFDLISLRAVNVLQGEVIGSLEDERREEEFRDGLARSSSSSSIISTSKEDGGGMEEKRETGRIVI
jgi:hypothetical protein